MEPHRSLQQHGCAKAAQQIYPWPVVLVEDAGDRSNTTWNPFGHGKGWGGALPLRSGEILRPRGAGKSAVPEDGQVANNLCWEIIY